MGHAIINLPDVKAMADASPPSGPEDYNHPFYFTKMYHSNPEFKKQLDSNYRATKDAWFQARQSGKLAEFYAPYVGGFGGGASSSKTSSGGPANPPQPDADKYGETTFIAKPYKKTLLGDDADMTGLL
jgi:hypothetical protein